MAKSKKEVIIYKNRYKGSKLSLERPAKNGASFNMKASKKWR